MTGTTDVAYYVALPFIAADDSVAAGKAYPDAAVMRAESLSGKPGCVGAVAFSRTEDPATAISGSQGYPNAQRSARGPERVEGCHEGRRIHQAAEGSAAGEGRLAGLRGPLY